MDRGRSRRAAVEGTPEGDAMKWSADELRKIIEADDLHISPFREDGVTPGTPTWIWAVAVDGDLYVRGYNGQKAPAALEEVFNIGRRAGCGVHVSHFNCLADQTIPLLDAARASGVDVTFDLYCYLYGSTIVAMLTLPPEVLEGGIDATVERLKQPAVRKSLESAFANPRFPIETIRLASLQSDEYRHLEGMGLVAAADAATLGARRTLQVHGAMGYTWEYDLQIWMKRVWAEAACWGTSARHRARIAGAGWP